MSCGCRRLQGFCMTCGFICSFWRSKTSRITRKTPAKKCQTPAKHVKLPQIPKSHTNNFFWNPPDHIVDCKPYDKCKVTEKFVATPGILNFTRKQEMLEISRKRMLQDIYIYIYRFISFYIGFMLDGGVTHGPTEVCRFFHTILRRIFCPSGCGRNSLLNRLMKVEISEYGKLLWPEFPCYL